VHGGERFLSSDVASRFLPFLAALAILAGVRSLSTPGAKIRFVLLVSLSPLLLLYSGEARAYALLAAMVLALFLLGTEAEEAVVTLGGIALLSAALVFTHYLSIFAVLAVAAVAAAEKRTRSALAVVAGSLPFFLWLPILLRQPPAAVAWMHEPAAELVTGIASSFGGAGRIPAPFGPPLPGALVALGSALALLIALSLALSWRDDTRLRRAAAFLVLFFGGVVFASLARPVAFAGRTELAVLPVWLWTVALLAERSRLARAAAWGVAAVSLVASLLLLELHRAPTLRPPLDALERMARPGDVLFTGAHFYLPARLDADRGKLGMTLHAFPLEQASHPGWAVPTRPRREDLLAVQRALDRAEAAGARVYFQVPPSFVRVLGPILARRGVVRQLADSPEMVLLVWSAGDQKTG
jgi:hypothetical protein